MQESAPSDDHQDENHRDAVPIVTRTPSRRARRWMARTGLAVPATWLQRLRRATLLLSLITIVLLIQVTLAQSEDPQRPQTSIAAVALVWLAVRWLREYVRPSTSSLWDCADGLALFTAGVVIDGPNTLAGLVYLCVLYSSLSFRSLSVSGRRVAVVVLVYYNVFIFAMIMTSVTDFADTPLAVGFAQLPSLAMIAGASHLLAQTMTRRDEEAARNEALLAGSDALRGITSVDEALACFHDASRALLRGAVIRTTVLAISDDGSIRPVAGENQDMPPGAKAEQEIARFLASHAAALQQGRTVNVDGRSPDRPSCDTRSWFAAPVTTLVPVSVQSALRGVLLVAGNQPVARAAVDDLARLAEEAAAAIKRILEASELREREAAYRSLVEYSSDAVVVLSDDHTIQFVSPVAARLFRRSASDLVGLPFTDLAHSEDLARVISYLERLHDGGEAGAAVDWRCRCEEDEWVALETRGTNLFDNQQIQGLLLTSRDISDRKALEDRLVHQAYHDPLTRLGNRALFLDQLKRELARPLRRSVSNAVMFLDLDRFKIINDTLGHDAGDQLLTTVADRLRDCVRGDDLVARLGGDEFAILLRDIIDEVPAIQIAERILHAMEEPIYLDGHRLFVTTSIGVALGSATRDLPDELIRRADVAMYEAKRMGKACYAVYDAGIDQHKIERLELEGDLRTAIRNRQIEVYYQPLISLDSGNIQQLEALVRWRHPDRGLLPPGEFIGVAEETGLILPIGSHVLREACHQVAAWQQHATTGQLQLSVNLSARQFRQPDLVDEIARTLGDTGLRPSHLTLEITESVAMTDIDASVALLHELKRLGVQIAIDDFGIGYSALNALKYFPVDSLKIDRSFVSGLGDDRGDAAIVGAVIACARALDLSVVAEGIEHPQQVRALRTLECDQGQGYLISAPLSRLDVPALLDRLSRPVAHTEPVRLHAASREAVEALESSEEVA